MKFLDSESSFYHASSEQNSNIAFKPIPKAGVHLSSEIELEKCISTTEISIVIPVRNNQVGIDRLLKSIVTEVPENEYPRQVIIIDNNSHVPIRIDSSYPFTVIVRKCSRPGPAAARNLGATCAAGKWLLFTDSDCVFTSKLISGYLRSDNECVAYAGRIEIIGEDLLSNYYRDQNALHPSFVQNEKTKQMEPWSLVTANCLIFKSAFDAIGGFDETFLIAGGEDTDLGFRLRHAGKVEFNSQSVAIHHFDDGFLGFIKRYIRYGRGNHRLNKLYHGSFWPKYFSPNYPSMKNNLLCWLAITSMRWGYCKSFVSEIPNSSCGSS